MRIKNVINNSKKYNNIKRYLTTKQLPQLENKSEKHRFIQKSSEFIIIGEILYKKEASENHKLAIHLEDLETMKMETWKEQNKHHVRLNKIEALLKNKYYIIKRDVIRSVCAECIACQASESLKKNVPLINIKASAPRERYQVDLVNLIELSESDEFVLAFSKHNRRFFVF
ncbi:hypothetical protein CDIK_0840 [Cucumispora dikerogammari]|nr:hypothetical protein CDIK_0840 [Cucumispora dikerogammari]